MLAKLRKVVATVVLLAIAMSAVPVGAATDSTAPVAPNLEIKVHDEDMVDLNGDGRVSVQEARLMASYRLAVQARQDYLDRLAAEGKEVPSDVAVVTPHDPRTITPEQVDSETIRNVLINLYARWEETWFQIEFLTKFALLGASVTAVAAMRTQWDRAGNLIGNLIGWSYLTSDIIRQQFTNLIRSAGYSETVANRVGVVMKQFVEWLCNHPEWFD